MNLFENLSDINLLEIKDFFKYDYEDEDNETDDGTGGNYGGHAQKISKAKFKSLLQKLLSLEISDCEFDEIFSKISTENGFVSWNDFLTYLMLEYREKKSLETIDDESKEITNPIAGDPLFQRTFHRRNLVRLTFFPYYEKNEVDLLNGCYISASADGTLNFWDLDLQLQKTFKAESLELKVQPTQITDLVSMFDVHIVCVSSTESDLRFYDTIGNRMNICMQISSFPYAIQTMAYDHSAENSQESKLLLGDTNGNISVIVFSTQNRGPFKSNPEVLINQSRYESLVKKGFLGMKLIEYRKVHSDWVVQVAFYRSLNSFISISESSERSMVVHDIISEQSTSTNYVFDVNKGVKCFALNEKSHAIATGGLDTVIRVWSTFYTRHPSSVLRGHSTAVLYVTFMRKGQRICSISKDKCVKVWNLLGSACLQTYMSLASKLTEQVPLAVFFYNRKTQQVLIGAKKFAILTVSKRMNADFTDGVSHTKSVSCLLFNSLFDCVVSCGHDSNIIVWNIYRGKKTVTITNAHFRLVYGEKVPVSITAACFDPSLHCLCTAASDGTLKVWNFRAGFCLRHMNTGDTQSGEISAVIWLKNRILLMSSSGSVTEFSQTEIKRRGNEWIQKHASAIVCADYDDIQTIATGSRDGELILWAAETGQPYKKMNVVVPNKYIKIEYNIPKENKEPVKSRRSSSVLKKKSLDLARRNSAFSSISYRVSNAEIDVDVINNKFSFRKQSITALLFLKRRPIARESGTLLVALENGFVQVWSHHASGSYLSSFATNHLPFDYVTAMATDRDNEFLFTGHSAGYIKVWLLRNFSGRPGENEQNQPESMHLYRSQFAFLRINRYLSRVWRSIRDQKYPILLSSVQAHLKPINRLIFVDRLRLLISCSQDFSVRIWSLYGQYFGTLGTFKKWQTIDDDFDSSLQVSNFQIPADIRRVASSTTMNVLTNVSLEKPMSIIQQFKKIEKQYLQNQENCDFDAENQWPKLEEPILGNYFQLPDFVDYGNEIDIERSVSHISAFTRLKLMAVEDIDYETYRETVRNVQKAT